MSYKVEIRDNRTGEVRVTEHEGEFDHFHWTEGNYGCDCNRELFFRRAGGEDPALDSTECGQSKYTAIRALVDGEWQQVDQR